LPPDGERLQFLSGGASRTSKVKQAPAVGRVHREMKS
jgi:hypothetical protein